MAATSPRCTAFCSSSIPPVPISSGYNKRAVIIFRLPAKFIARMNVGDRYPCINIISGSIRRPRMGTVPTRVGTMLFVNPPSGNPHPTTQICRYTRSDESSHVRAVRPRRSSPRRFPVRRLKQRGEMRASAKETVRSTSKVGLVNDLFALCRKLSRIRID